MAQFNDEKVGMFLGVVRKYMQVRGPLSQKDLAELTDTGVSTMSRFLNQKTTELNPQLIAKIVAKLNIPLHEMIDFVDETFTDHFIRLVKFYKDEEGAPPLGSQAEDETEEVVEDEFESSFNETLSTGSAKRNTTARVKIGGKSREIPFRADEGGRSSTTTIKEKLESLSPRQKAYMTDFLSLDMEGRDLIVDIGNSLFRYFRQRGVGGLEW